MAMLIKYPKTKEECLANKDFIQKRGKTSWHNNNGIGVFEWATGVGKSKPAIEIVDELRHDWLSQFQKDIQILLVTPTEEMRDENWPLEFEKWGVSMDGIKSIAYASLGKQDLSKYDLIIYDEYHRITLGNLRKLQDALDTGKLMLLGLSATLPTKGWTDDDKERIKLMKELCPTVDKVTLDEAVDYGLVCDFEMHVLKFYMESVKEEYDGGTKAKPFKQTEKARYNWLTKKVQFAMIQVAKSPAKKGFEFKAIGERCQFIYGMNSKMKLARECLKRLNVNGQRTLVFAGSIDHANELCGENVYHSESNREALDKFQNKEIPLLGSVKAMDEGLNITEPDNALIMQVTSVERSLYQRTGRLLRKRYDKLDHKAVIVVLVAANSVDEQWFNKASQNLESSRIITTMVRVPD
jgi:superfamily II DNA or RNA helicase